MTNKDNMIRKLVLSILIGIAIGQMIALISLWAASVTEISLDKLAVVIIVSGLIGLVSSLLFDITELPAKMAYPTHFISVFGLVIIMNVLNGWADIHTLIHHIFSVFLQFLLIYLGVWLFVTYLTHQKVSQINEKIKERKKQVKDKVR